MSSICRAVLVAARSSFPAPLSRCASSASVASTSTHSAPRHGHKVSVVLKEQLDNLGYKGEEVTVAPGYARNYLIPQQKASYATDLARRTLKVVLPEAEAKAIAQQREINMLKARIAAVKLNFTRTTTDGVNLYSGITPADIVEALNNSFLKNLGIREKNIRFASEERVLKVAGAHTIELEPRTGLWTPISVAVESG